MPGNDAFRCFNEPRRLPSPYFPPCEPKSFLLFALYMLLDPVVIAPTPVVDVQVPNVATIPPFSTVRLTLTLLAWPTLGYDRKCRDHCLLPIRYGLLKKAGA